MNAFERDITLLRADPETGTLGRPTGDVEGIKEEVLESLARQRAEILSLPSDESGLDIEGVQAYFREQGLRMPAHVILDRETVPRFQELVGQMIPAQDPVENRSGMYHEVLDIAVVYRDKAMEHRNGAAYTEGVLAHEGGHGTNEIRGLTCLQVPGLEMPITWQARVGFTTTPVDTRHRRGELFEEAYAERKAAGYRQAVGAYAGRRKKSGFSLPDEYIQIVNAKGRFHVTPEAMMAFMFDLLSEVRPGLPARMEDARKSVTGIAKFARILNRLEDGLYAEIRALPNDVDGVSTAIHRLMDVYQGNRQQSPRVVIPSVIQSS